MKKRLLPIPLILLIPIVLLIAVVIAGVYRFSIDDEVILAKFNRQSQVYDPIVKQVFDIQSPNPWTIQVPEAQAFAFIDTFNEQSQRVLGSYDTGAERGQVTVSTKWLTFIDTNQYVSVMTVSNQGSGLFNYLAAFRYDSQRKRMVLVNELLIGDRIQIDQLKIQDSQLTLNYRQHRGNQPLAEVPSDNKQMEVTVNRDLKFLLHNK
ncbi:hypothetical protein L4C38_11380 [Vibrio kasasachensis]|uniref:hypothetical protein n=1 Tax=Vibrio kasasachensis TaxID=2910248 RepID=UPI003D0BB151